MTQYIRTENGPLARITTVSALRSAFQNIEVQDASMIRAEPDPYGPGKTFAKVEKPRIPLHSFVKAERALREAGYVLVKIEQDPKSTVDCDLCPEVFNSLAEWRAHAREKHVLVGGPVDNG